MASLTKPFTAHHLALHRAGLVVEGTSPPGDSREAFLQGIRRSPAESKPEDRYRYTNAGYGVLAAIIEIVSGTPYNDYLRREILLPLGLREAYFRGETVPALRSAIKSQRTTRSLLLRPPGPRGITAQVA